MVDVLNDPLFRPSLIAFCQQQQTEELRQLIQAIRQPERDTMREAQLAGKVEVYETIVSDLDRFAAEQLEKASQ
jgi:hypothetical protein